MKKNRYDIIIIGSGISGLIAGAYLAKHGRKVLIAEKNNNVGGCCSSFFRGGIEFDAGAHIIGSCYRKNLFGSILNELKVNSDFIRLAPADLIHFPNDTISISASHEEFRSYLVKRFKCEKRGLDLFFNILLKANDPQSASHIIKKYVHATYQTLLDGLFTDVTLKSILSVQCGYLGLPPRDVSAVSTIFMLRSYLVDGAFYPKNGSQALSNSIADAFRDFGGDIFLNSEVDKILTKSDQVKSVLIDGNEINSNVIIAASDVLRTYKKLMNLNIRKEKRFYGKLAAFKPSCSGCILYLGLSEKMDLKDKHGWYYDSYDIDSSFAKQIYVHIPENNHHDALRKGVKRLVAISIFDYGKDKKMEREKFKEDIADDLLFKLEKRIPGISEKIVIKNMATPLTIERYTFNSRGAFYGWMQSPGQTYTNFFPAKSFIKGLFHAGHWTSPGGGIVAVALSGINVAKKILRNS